MYKAKITKKEIKNGTLKVEVHFSNGVDAFIDSFETNQAQDDNWIGNQIRNKLNHLNSIPKLGDSIELGDFDEALPDPTDAEIYRDKVITYNRYMQLARDGFVAHDRPFINELREWIKDNFKDDYIDIL